MANRQLSAFEKGAIAALAPRASLAGALLEAWSELPEGSVQNARTLVSYAQLGVTEERAAEEVLELAVAAGLLERRETGFAARPNALAVFPRLAFALASVQYYLTAVHQEATRVQVVLTKPPRPSVLEQKLSELGWRTADLEATDHAFNSLVRSARRKVVVMTPFFDERGAAWLQELFGFVSAGVERFLILRSLEDSSKRDYPTGFSAIQPWLAAQQVKVFNYSIPRASGIGRETFHAKVVVVDRRHAYVGSSNVTAASLDHSMEMGVTLEGKAVASVAEVIDAVLLVSTRLL
jgi:phosphatidylserine/phosphatidylglycerophosphate/cardiolipin synthase-like enzyme